MTIRPRFPLPSVPGNREVVERAVLARAGLREKGWFTFVVSPVVESSLREDLLSLASQLGRPQASRVGGDVCDVLRPTAAAVSRRRSLSSIYSIAEFPLHVDTAHWITPARFLLLACLRPGSGDRRTVLLDVPSVCLSDAERLLLSSTPLRVRNGRHSFFSTALSKGRGFARVDRGCMSPVNSEGDRVLDFFAETRWATNLEEVAWEAGKILVVDNWRCLHGRGNAVRSDEDRMLLRVLVS